MDLPNHSVRVTSTHVPRRSHPRPERLGKTPGGSIGLPHDESASGLVIDHSGNISQELLLLHRARCDAQILQDVGWDLNILIQES